MTTFVDGPIQVVPLEVGRNPSVDGATYPSEYLSEVRVINITNKEVSEIKTSVITLPQGVFPVPDKTTGDPAVAPISVFANDVANGYVQWEPMGDIYEPTAEAPLGSYKYLRVKWDCYVPAGSNTADYSKGGSVSGPYDFYAEKIYTFRREEPAQFPNFTLTPGVLSALGVNCQTPTTFEFSAHGYVNQFDFYNGLYGQDKQRAFPQGHSLLPAERDVIYDQNFDEVGSTTENPSLSNIGQECLAKEYTVRGRIVPELDFDGAALEVIQEGDPAPSVRTGTILSTSGRDAPPFWYNFNYELQHQKNIIPFSFVWGVGLLTYNEGTYDPQGATMDLQDKYGRAEGTPKLSNNTGPRRRSSGTPNSWVEWLRDTNRSEAFHPTTFHSQDDITFSVLGPDIVCHASSVNVCSVSTETINSIKKTVINWFDKANQQWYDIEVYGVNNLPSSSTWVLRGCIHINSRYLPNINLSTRDINSQLSNSQERTWAIDMNFGERNLFTLWRNPLPPPPEDLLQNRLGQGRRYENGYQTACLVADAMWDDDSNRVNYQYFPEDIATQQEQVNAFENPFYNSPPLASNVTVGFLKGLHEPWAMNPIGIQARSGGAGEQPAFGYAGPGVMLAGAKMPDARFLEACVDLEWNNRLSIEVTRDARLVDQFDDAWTFKRFVELPSTITNTYLNDAVRRLTNNPNYQGWINKSYDDPEFRNAHRLVDNFSTLGYYGSNVAYGGTEVIAKNGRGFGINSHTTNQSRADKTYGVNQYLRIGRIRGGESRRTGEVLASIDFTNSNSVPLSYLSGVYGNRGIRGITYNPSTQLFYCIYQKQLWSFDQATNAFDRVSDTIPLDHFGSITYDPVQDKLFGIGVKNVAHPLGTSPETYNYDYDFYFYSINADGSNLTVGSTPFYSDQLYNKGNNTAILNAIRFIEYNSVDSKFYGFKQVRPTTNAGRRNANYDLADPVPKLIEYNIANNTFTEKFTVGFSDIVSFNDVAFSGTSNTLLVPRVDESLGNTQKRPVDTLNVLTGAIDTLLYLPNSEINGSKPIGIAQHGSEFLLLELRTGGVWEPGQTKVGYPVPKRQANSGYPSHGLWSTITTREGFTPSHSAWGPLISYAQISGDKLTLQLLDYSMRILMITHHDSEHIRELYYMGQGMGANWRNAARMEGRPLHCLVGGIGLTRNNKLRERAIATLSRRFWNIYYPNSWEDYPTGSVPGKPWQTLRYPPWANGVSAVYDRATQIPTWHVLGPFNQTFDDYNSAYAGATNFKKSKYNTAGLKIREIAPDFDPSRASVWHYNDIGSAQNATKHEVYVPPYEELQYVNESQLFFWSLNRNTFQYDRGRLRSFRAKGWYLDPPRPGQAGTVVKYTDPYANPPIGEGIDYLAYKFECSEDPLQYKIWTPPLASLNVTSIPVSAHPDVTAVPIGPEGEGLEQRRPNNYSTQPYQQSLIYPYIYPMVDIFLAYSKIYFEKARRDPQAALDFVSIHDTYGELGAELADSYLEAKEYFVDVAKTQLNNMLGTTTHPNTDPRYQDLYLISYMAGPYSAERPYEYFTLNERTFCVDRSGNIDKVNTPITCLSYIKSGNRVQKKPMGYGKMGAYISTKNRLSGGVAGTPWSTNAWAFCTVVWAWDVLKKHADLENSEILEVADRASDAIYQYYGSGYNPVEVAADSNLKDNFYIEAIYGVIGWPAPGLASRKLAALGPGDQEVMPWLVGMTDDLWQDRTIDTTVKVIQGNLRTGTELNGSFEVIDGQTKNYVFAAQPSALLNPGKGVYPFATQSIASKNSLPRTIEAIRDLGMSALYVNGGETNQFDFAALETRLNAIAANNCQANVRIHIDYPRQLEVVEEPGQPRRYVIRFPQTQDYRLPKFLRTEFGGPVASYPYLTAVNISNGVPNIPYSIGVATSGYIPDYNSPELKAECLRLIAELGRVYDGDPRIIEFQIGFGGHWGEWNNYAAFANPERDANGNPIFPVRWTQNPPASFLSDLSYAFDSAFKTTFLTGRYLDGRNNGRPLPDTPILGLTSLQTRVGQHDDSLGWNSIDDPRPWYTETQQTHYEWTNKYVSAYMGGETRPEIARNGDAYNNTFSGTTYSTPPQNLRECIRRLKISSISEGIAFGYFGNGLNTAEQLQNMLLNIYTLGYNFTVRSASFLDQINLSQDFNVSITLENVGVAPFYQNWPAVISLTDGVRSVEVESSYNLSSILPGTPTTITATIPNNQIIQVFSSPTQVSVHLKIRKPAAFLRDITFMNAEHIQSTPNMNLGSLSLTQSETKIITGLATSGSSELTGEITRVQDILVSTRDIGNEAYLPKMDATVSRLLIQRFQNLEIETSTEPTIGQIEAQGRIEFTTLSIETETSLEGNVEKQGNIEFIEFIVEGFSEPDGFIDSIENKDPPAIKLITGSVICSSNIELDNFDISRNYSNLSIDTSMSLTGDIIGVIGISNYDSSGLSELDSYISKSVILDSLEVSSSTFVSAQEIDGYAKLPNLDISLSSACEGSITSEVKVNGSIESSSEISTLKFTLGHPISMNMSSRSTLDGELTRQVFEPEFTSNTDLQGSIFVILGSRLGESSDQGSGFGNLILGEKSQDPSSVSAEIDLIKTRRASSQSSFMNFEQKLIKEISQRSAGDAQVTEIYKETLQYLLNVFSQYIYINDQNELKKIPCWHGSVERVVAKLRQEQNIILPVVSLFRTGNRNDENRRRTSSMIVYDKYWDNEKQRAVRVARLAPIPVSISYKLNVWTKYQEDMDHITEQVLRDFNPDISIQTSFNTTTKAYLQSESPSNELTTAEGQDRIVRKVFDITVESYIPTPRFVITNTGKIEEFNAEVYFPIR